MNSSETARQGSPAPIQEQYGAGKSHLLAYLAQQVSLGRPLSDPPDLVPISLGNSKHYKRSFFAAVQDVNQRHRGRHHLHILEKLAVQMAEMSTVSSDQQVRPRLHCRGKNGRVF